MNTREESGMQGSVPAAGPALRILRGGVYRMSDEKDKNQGRRFQKLALVLAAIRLLVELLRH